MHYKHTTYDKNTHVEKAEMTISGKIDEFVKILRDNTKKDIESTMSKWVNNEELYPLYMETFIEYIDCVLSDALFEMSMKCINELKNKDVALKKLDSYMEILVQNMKERIY